MTDILDLLPQIACLMQFNNKWHCRRVGQSVFAVGATPVEAIQRAFGQFANDDLF